MANLHLLTAETSRSTSRFLFVSAGVEEAVVAGVSCPPFGFSGSDLCEPFDQISSPRPVTTVRRPRTGRRTRAARVQTRTTGPRVASCAVSLAGGVGVAGV